MKIVKSYDPSNNYEPIWIDINWDENLVNKIENILGDSRIRLYSKDYQNIHLHFKEGDVKYELKLSKCGHK